jgi:hypothetical protein
MTQPTQPATAGTTPLALTAASIAFILRTEQEGGTLGEICIPG